MAESVSKKFGNLIQIDEEQIQQHLSNLICGTMEETLNKLLDAMGHTPFISIDSYTRECYPIFLNRLCHHPVIRTDGIVKPETKENEIKEAA